MKTITLDCEVYSNYFLAQFKDHASGKTIAIEKYNNSTLDRSALIGILERNVTIGFNSLSYDLPIIAYALTGASNQQIKKLSDEIVMNGDAPWQTLRKYDLEIPMDWEHIDIKDPSPGVMVGLKTYGARLGAKRLQDLPIDPSETINETQRKELKAYCENDLDVTWLLYQNVKHEIDLRAKMSDQLGKDLRSFGGAKVAKEYFLSRLGLKNVKPVTYKKGHKIKYAAPSFIKFESKELQQVLHNVQNADYEIKDTGHIELPKEIGTTITFDGAKYKFGIGGLHSQESAQTVEECENYALDMRDVTSFYPSIILGEKLYPKTLGIKFLNIYDDVFKTRVSAKKSGDKYTADSLKLVLNSSFGLFGNKFSPLYSPDLLLAVTLTGQLSLLMLIEMLKNIGVKTVSANTDGIAIYYPRTLKNEVDTICFDWELTTGYGLETEVYKGIYSASVNTYLGLEPNGKFKAKGLFADSILTTNPQFNVCVDAVKAFIRDGIKLEQTIEACTDVSRFLCVRSVKGGAVWRNQYLGKTVRWYWSTDGESILYKTNGNKVAKSDYSTPLMELPNKLTDNIDYQRYVNEAREILKSIGYR
jgi:hypothetical protein